jgi:hypothetical protein
VSETTPSSTGLELHVERYVRSDEPKIRGMRGVTLDATTGYFSGRVFSTSFPTVYVTDAGDIEFSDERVPTDVAAAWFRAVADYLDAAPQRVIEMSGTSRSATDRDVPASGQ